jgi:hypothetical protein
MSRLDALASFFKARPGDWIDGRELMSVSGQYAWRTRVSELRRRGFRIVNRQRRYADPRTGARVLTISEYRYEPDPRNTEARNRTRGHSPNSRDASRWR